MSTHCLLAANLLSADNLDKQFGPRSGPTEGRAWYGSKLFDTRMLFLKEYFEKSSVEKYLSMQTIPEQLPSRQRVNEQILMTHMHNAIRAEILLTTLAEASCTV